MTDEQPTINILVGTSEHTDPWHALNAVAAAVTDLLSLVGHVNVRTTADEPSRLDSDLLVVIASGDLEQPPTDSTKIIDAILRHHRAGRSILALHASALAFRDDERWCTILGGRWVPGSSNHPQIGHALVQVTPQDDVPADLPAFDRDFVLYDERYSHLEATGVEVLARHTEDGVVHPLVWGRSAGDRRGAVVYDALGHGVESFASPDHAAWLIRSARSLLRTRKMDA